MVTTQVGVAGRAGARAETSGRPKRSGRWGRMWRHLLVSLHVVSSVSWLSQAAALAVLLVVAAAPGRLPARMGAAQAAQVLDGTVLVFSANVSAATGFLLAALTSWGFFHFGWVAAKFVMTIGQLYLGIFLLSGRLDALPARLPEGNADGVLVLVVATTLMASAFTVQVWLSVAKPGGRIRPGRVKPATAPTWMFAVATLAPIGDVAFGVILGNPTPVLSFAALAVAGILRLR